MLRVLIELWPMLLPLLAYWLWHMRRARAARGRDEIAPQLREGPWLWAVLASAAIAFVLLFGLGLSADSDKGPYIPPHLENGKIAPGKVER